ncbi:MAG: adenylate kinase family protein [Candidatus Natronoplasma sp.]
MDNECALTGTPGVGKTTVSELLKEEGYEVLDLNRFIREKDLLEDEDAERGSFNVDTKRLREVFLEEGLEHDIVEGHLSHHLKLSPTIVLRCSPTELKKRMKEKGWSGRKVQENAEAEALDVILVEALEACDEVYEVDTTERTPQEVADRVKDIFKGETENYIPGSIDWAEEYLDKL